MFQLHRIDNSIYFSKKIGLMIRETNVFQISLSKWNNRSKDVIFSQCRSSWKSFNQFSNLTYSYQIEF